MSWDRTKKVLSVAVGLAGALAMGMTGVVANAATTAPEFGNIDTAKKGSIIIHKHEHQNGTDATAQPDGSSNITTPGIAGVEFTVYRIDGLDLANADSWNGLSEAKAPQTVTPGTTTISLSSQSYGFTKVASVTTDAQGEATVSSLPVAAYVVVETNRPSTVVDIAQSFIVTIPFPDHDNTKGWLYDVNVYPKNGSTTVDKTVLSQEGLGIGSVAQFPVTTRVPKIADNANYKYYIIHDDLDSRLTPSSDLSVTVDGQAVDKSFYTVTVTGQAVDVSFTKDGLAWLKTIPNKSVVTTFKGTVTSIGNGVIPNKASLYADTEISDEPPVPPVVPPVNPPVTPPVSPEVHQNWGDLVISKVDADKDNAGLSGAEFEVYAAKDAYADSCTATATTGDPITVDGKSTFTSDANGKITVAGLFVSDSKNAPIDASQRCYVIKETKAPAGFVLPDGDAALTAVTVKTGQTAGVDVTVKNTKQNVPNLPMTGSTGIAVMVVVGLALILGAGALTVSRRRSLNK
ncbi:MAG: SpaH/EbpB family LPXTG-anchored major pilin [Bifidobacterium sp.]|jgi:fimbrial isopeptide formation D2 family protein/LPXTG-motif cell wall-anchored protein|nr:SpaH/EbpB family LPXTG-anchored major pilin [Bifidobacterium sp.]MCH4175248.1 SpaH/EbpB family LPXTG-anchored major pilin [Bifidobacterium sp.]